MLANYHTHTSRCNHAYGEDREYVENAIAAGMKFLGFSDHCPWDYGDGYVSPIRMLPSQIDDYFFSLDSLRKEYSRDITIYIGFEAEYVPELIDAQQRLLEGYPLDYMIIGQHYNGRDDQNRYNGYSTLDREQFTRYIDLIIEGMETGRYAYAAHPDLLRLLDDEYARAEFTRLCRYFKEKDLPIEINMVGLCGGKHYPSELLMKIAAEVGNSAIIGCDAHVPQALSAADAIGLCEKVAEVYGLPLVDYLPGLGPKEED